MRTIEQYLRSLSVGQGCLIDEAHVNSVWRVSKEKFPDREFVRKAVKENGKLIGASVVRIK